MVKVYSEKMKKKIERESEWEIVAFIVMVKTIGAENENSGRKSIAQSNIK